MAGSELRGTPSASGNQGLCPQLDGELPLDMDIEQESGLVQDDPEDEALLPFFVFNDVGL